MKKSKVISAITFICSLLIVLISVRLFWNLGVYVDEYGTSPDVVNGGQFWLMTDWFRLILSFVITILSGLNLFNRRE